VIRQIHREILGWIQATLAKEDKRPSSGLVSRINEGTEPAIRLYLLEISNEPMARGSRKPPRRFVFRYLITASAEDLAQAHAWIWTLLREALQSSERSASLPPATNEGTFDPSWSVESDSLSPAFWTSLEAIPQPAFVVRVPVLIEREQKLAPRVKEVVLRAGPVTKLLGRVVGPKNVPLMGATVAFPALGLTASTKPDGSFVLMGVPTKEMAQTMRLVVSAKGQSEEILLKGEGRGAEEPLLIQPTFLES